LGLDADLSTRVPGLTAYAEMTSGKDAINPSSGAKLADELGYDVGAVWTLK